MPSPSVPSRLFRLFALATLACCLSAVLPGCNVRHHRTAEGDEHVKVDMPFGSVNVKTDKSGAGVDTGITVYPGATPFHDKDHDENNADVGLSFGSFHLGVHAAEFQTTDSEDKVLAFYHKDLARYGDVIECQGNQAVGNPQHTSGGLSCDENDRHPGTIHISGQDSADRSLRAGSPEHQHIVSLDSHSGSIRLGLTAVDLPHTSHGSDEQ